jgi:RNA recognition motif-containing protein
MDLYVNNIAPGTEEKDLQELFSGFGEVVKVNINKTSFTKFNKGSAFVKMNSREEGLNAIEGLNGKSLKGKKITVSEARGRS